jgi:hypothetical protein
MRYSMRFLAAAGAVVFMLVVAPGAQATTGTGAQNPDLEVVASLTNVGDGADGDADTAQAGELVTAAASVENTTDRRQLVWIAIALRPPGGETLTIRYPYIIGAGRTESVDLTFPILRFVPPGEYAFTLSATGRGGTSSAEARLAVVR